MSDIEEVFLLTPFSWNHRNMKVGKDLQDHQVQPVADPHSHSSHELFPRFLGFYLSQLNPPLWTHP